MLEYSTRRLLSVVTAAAVCTVTAIVGGAAPAHATASGYLLTKGTGSIYTQNPAVFEGGIPGGAARTFSYKVVNSGYASKQFKVSVSDISTKFHSTLLLGTTVLPNPYYTAPIPPGKSIVLTVKVKVDSGVSPSIGGASVSLQDPDTNTYLDTANAYVSATYQTGSTAHDFFLKTGSQPLVGGSVAEAETPNTLKVGSTATFVLRLKNDSNGWSVINLAFTGADGCLSSFKIVYKQGTKDVTAAVNAGTFATNTLAPGAHQDLKMTIKLLAATSCTGVLFFLRATGADGTIDEYPQVVIAA